MKKKKEKPYKTTKPKECKREQKKRKNRKFTLEYGVALVLRDINFINK